MKTNLGPFPELGGKIKTILSSCLKKGKKFLSKQWKKNFLAQDFFLQNYWMLTSFFSFSEKTLCLRTFLFSFIFTEVFFKFLSSPVRAKNRLSFTTLFTFNFFVQFRTQISFVSQLYVLLIFPYSFRHKLRIVLISQFCVPLILQNKLNFFSPGA